MKLDFSSLLFKELAFRCSAVSYETKLTAADAFLLVIKDLDYETLDVLCKIISNDLEIDSIEFYKMLQYDKLDKETKDMILDKAYDIISDGYHLGSKRNGSYYASSWVEHSLYEGHVASILAHKMGLDEDTAMKLGILHDIGRKFDHSFFHTIKGFEYLTAMGFEKEAICCLTHSFLPVLEEDTLRGNRCACCDPALEGFSVDENGRGVFKDNSMKDDMTLFLEKYNYNSYDIILNIADLMATSNGITSPYERMLDIYSRKTPDSKNSPFFKVCFINSLNRLLFQMTQDEKYERNRNIKEFSSLDEIDDCLIDTSNDFIDQYNQLLEEEKVI